MDWIQYWFMFPVAIAVATCAALSGIGGAALFIPIFVILFPMLGPEYPLTTSAAIGSALLTMVFGFSSSFTGYYRKQLIDFGSSWQFIRVSVPIAVLGASLFGLVQQHDALLKGAYAALMLGLCLLVLRRSAAPPPSPGPDGAQDTRPMRTVVSRGGETYRFPAPRQGRTGAVFTAGGAFLTGFLGVGIGEVVLPQLIKRNRVPVPVAAATSVFVVIVTIASASFMQIWLLIEAGGLSAVPWNLVCYTVPAVVIGGQLGPLLQGRIPQRVMERSIAGLFAAIGLAMAWIALRDTL